MGGSLRRARWLCVLLLAGAAALGPFSGAAAAAVPTAPAPAPDPCGLLPAPPVTYSHVVVIMEENFSYDDTIGDVNAPYLNQLASQCALATNFHNETHPSQPNYMAATSGFVTGVDQESTNPSIYEQVSSWNDLEESMGANCGVKGPHYKHGHDPAFWYPAIAADCLFFDLPMAESDAGATALPTAAFTWLTPNQCHNHHWQNGCTGPSTPDGFTQSMDTWLSGTIQAIQATPDYQAGQTLVLVTFDEGQGGTAGEDCADPANTDPSCHVVTVAVGAGVQPVADPTFYTHYSMLRSVEDALGVTTFLGNAATATDMRPGMGF
jgi:phosphatidylinositol-3-phosphatase